MKELLKCPVYVDQCTLLVHKDVLFCHDKANWNLSPYTDVPPTGEWRGVEERQVRVISSWNPGFNHFCCSDCVWLCDKEWCEILQIWHTNCEMYGSNFCGLSELALTQVHTMKLLENVKTRKLESVTEGQWLSGFGASDVKHFVICYTITRLIQKYI